MKKYVITIEELILKNFVVEANNTEDTLEKAEKKYRNSEFVLEQEIWLQSGWQFQNRKTKQPSGANFRRHYENPLP